MTPHAAHMRLALLKATQSPDPSTQNGAILVADDEAISVTAACNEFPAGVEYMSERWERPLKYDVIEHAERNAIYAAARNGIATKGLTLVCAWAACADCARAIIQAGLSELVTLAPTEAATHARWTDTVEIGMVMLGEAGVKVTYLDGSDFHDAPPLRRNGQPWSPC